MTPKIKGIHHITAIAGNAKRNYDFYTKVLGLRFVKKTVNFDDPHTYHFYFGDEVGSAGTILTFFPWEGITRVEEEPEWRLKLVILSRKEALISGENALKNLM